MNFRSIINTAARLWTASMVLFCVSCSEIAEYGPEIGNLDKNDLRPVTLNIAVAHPDADLTTRALTYDDLTFTQDEAAVKNLVTFIVSVDNEGNEVYSYEDVEYIVTEINPVEFYKGVYILEHQIEVEPGKKHIYIGANMKRGHIDAFMMGKPLSLEGEGPAVNMIMTPDPSYSGKGTDILMSGQVELIEGNTTTKEITIDEETKEYYLQGDLERLTAKVLLTCKEGEPGLVATGGKGWVETDKIRYTLNTENRQTYINKHTAEGIDINVDPNWEIENWVTSDGEITGADYGQQFDFWTSVELKGRLFDERYSASPLRYDEGKIGEGNSPNHYTEGIYTLENTAFNNSFLENGMKDKAAHNATTHVVMAVRFIPKKIYNYAAVNDPANNKPVSYEDGTLTWDNVFSSFLVAVDGHQIGTYWTRKEAGGEVRYYGHAAMNRYIALNPGSAEEFTCYEGGWSYFTTFVDGDLLNNKKLTYANMEYWGVERDHYYILAIDSITQPGSPFPDNAEYIKINSITTNWVDRGSQEVSISPKGGQ